ncbi:MAG: N-acetylmuramoyl-L-alanine amidase [Proteobacteria bacterium]|nr:N-acetylmuramoyl-L-alanine amidase [Pseudomonadota bacterium]
MTETMEAVAGAEQFAVRAHRLTVGGAAVPFRQSPHGGIRMKPLFLVIHYTAGLSATSAVNWFLDPRAKASAHLVIGRQGAATQHMAFDRTCWHAGQSAWKGLDGLNGHSIGIEIVNAGKLAKGPGGRWQTWTGEAIPDSEVMVARHRNEAAETGWHAYSGSRSRRWSRSGRRCTRPTVSATFWGTRTSRRAGKSIRGRPFR